MTDRYTRVHAESAFQALCKATGKRVATDWNDVGAWRLDHAFGGRYVIEEIVQATYRDGIGITTHPMGERFRSAREFYDVCWFAVEALRIKARELAAVD